MSKSVHGKFTPTKYNSNYTKRIENTMNNDMTGIRNFDSDITHNSFKLQFVERYKYQLTRMLDMFYVYVHVQGFRF